MSVLMAPAFSSHSLPGISTTKRQIRSTQRLLARTLAADVRREQERKLQALQSVLESAVHGVKERHIVRKYRMVRFFEGKKAQRVLKQAKDDFKNGKEGAEEALERAAADVEYVKNFPKGRKYVALFPTGKMTLEEEAKVEKTRAEIRKEISAAATEIVPMMAFKSGSAAGHKLAEDDEDEEILSDEDDEDLDSEEDSQGSSSGQQGQSDSGSEEESELDSDEDDDEDDSDEDDSDDSEDTDDSEASEDESEFDSEEESEEEESEEDDARKKKQRHH